MVFFIWKGFGNNLITHNNFSPFFFFFSDFTSDVRNGTLLLTTQLVGRVIEARILTGLARVMSSSSLFTLESNVSPFHPKLGSCDDDH
jgi:hypothetical protein